MRRLVDATRNSARALRHLLAHEKAFRLEVTILVAALFVAYPLSDDWQGYALLVASVLLILVVETLNTAVEAACNAVSRERDPDIAIAKDCGSLAVALAGLIAAFLWAAALFERIAAG